MILGLNPGSTLYDFFVSPLVTPLRPSRTGGQGGAADPDRHRPRHRLSRQCLEHRRGGPNDHRRHRRRRRRAGVLGRRAASGSCPLMFVAGVLGGMPWAAIPAFLKTQLRSQRDPDQPDADLCRDAGAEHPGPRPVARPGRLQLPADAHVHRGRHPAGDPRRHPPACRRPGRARRRRRAWVLLSRTVIGFQIKVVGQAPAAARFAGFSQQAASIWFTLLLAGGLAGLAGMIEVAGPIGQLTPATLPRLRLHRHHRGLPRPPATRWASSSAGLLHGAVLHRRRERPGRCSACRRRRPACSRACCCSSCSPRTSSSATASASVRRRRREVAAA